MRELNPFENRLAAGLEAVVGPRRPVDAAGIARRAVTGGSLKPEWRRVLGPIGSGGPTRRAGAFRVAFAALVIGVAALVAITVGSRLIAPPPDETFQSSPVATAQPSSIVPRAGCSAWQERASHAARAWTVGRAPAAISSVGSGFIAVVSGGRYEIGNVVQGTDPQIGLLDPVTGALCSVVDVPDHDYISEGPIWSPDGSALAFVASIAPGWAAGDELEHEVFVLSSAGLFRAPGFGTLRWSLDGAGLSLLQTSHSPEAFATTLSVIRADDTTPVTFELCDPCRARNVVWNAAGTMLAGYFEDELEGQTGPRPPGIAIVDLRAMTVSTLSGVPDLENASGGQLTAWIDDSTVLGVRLDGHGFGIPIADPSRFVDLGMGHAVVGDTSPDGSREVVSLEGPGANDRFVIRERATGREVIIAQGPDLWGGGALWSPDGRQVILRKFDEAQQSFVDGIWIVDTDGSNLRQLTTLELQLTVGGWQPTW